jgi:hypothetical protein
MLKINDYVKMGLNEDVLVDAIRKSALTKKLPLEERVYVGITAKYVSDGSDFGTYTVDKIFIVQPYYYNRAESIVYFRKIIDGKSNTDWDTGNRNVTLSPWDSEILLAEYEQL